MRLPLGDQAHEVLRLQPRQLGRERTDPDVVHARCAQHDRLAPPALEQVGELAFGKEDLFGVRLERDGQAAQSERAGAVG